MIFSQILNLLLLGLVTGLITWPIAEIVTDESGPFDIFNRLRIALIPEFFRPVSIEFDLEDLQTDFSQYENTRSFIDFFKAYDSELDFIQVYLTYDDRFNASIRGTLFNILNCKFCFGVWTALCISQAVVLFFYGSSVFSLLLGILAWPIGVTSQRAIINYFNKRH